MCRWASTTTTTRKKKNTCRAGRSWRPGLERNKRIDLAATKFRQYNWYVDGVAILALIKHRTRHLYFLKQEAINHPLVNWGLMQQGRLQCSSTTATATSPPRWWAREQVMRMSSMWFDPLTHRLSLVASRTLKHMYHPCCRTTKHRRDSSSSSATVCPAAMRRQNFQALKRKWKQEKQQKTAAPLQSNP